METLSWIIFFALLGALIWLEIKFGIVNVDPRHIAIRRNVWTGSLKELKPGLNFIIPGLHENFRLVDCRQVIHDPPVLTVTSRDGQPVDVDYQITLWVDGFIDQTNLNEGQAIKAATKIGQQEGEEQTSQERFKKDIEVIGLKESNVAIQNMISDHALDDLIGPEKKMLPVFCPNCRSNIEKQHMFCPNSKCTKSEGKSEEKAKKEGRSLDEFKIPTGFFERLSWAAGIALNDFLGDKYGLGCFLKIRNARYPEDTERAARSQKIATMEGDATKARLDREAVALKNLIESTNTNPNVAFLGTKLMEIIPEMMLALKGERKKTEGREKK